MANNLGLDRLRRSFLVPLAAILDFAGGAALQAVSGEPVPPAPLGLDSQKLFSKNI